MLLWSAIIVIIIIIHHSVAAALCGTSSLFQKYSTFSVGRVTLTLNGETSLSYFFCCDSPFLWANFLPKCLSYKHRCHTKLTRTTVPTKLTYFCRCTFNGFAVIFKNVTKNLSNPSPFMCIRELEEDR